MKKNLSLEIKKIANKDVINAIGDLSNVSVDTVKMISSLSKENDLYSEVFIRIADTIRLGLDTYTIRRIAENIFEDIQNSRNKLLGIKEEFAKTNVKAA